MEAIHFSPAEISERFIETGCKKAGQPALRLFLLAILAGAFIAFASEGSNVAIHTIESVGLAKTLSGALFSAGLMMVVVTGAELFTGNALIVVSCLERQSGWLKLLKNWGVVYAGNFAGCMIVVAFILLSGQLDFSGGLLGGYTIKVAAYKVGLTFSKAIFHGRALQLAGMHGGVDGERHKGHCG
jgi:formate/nitrite transporter FocA (FNT family)